jgi:hypothetical protein
MFVLRQFYSEVSQKIAKLDWLGEGAASAEQFRIFTVRLNVTVAITCEGWS